MKKLTIPELVNTCKAQGVPIEHYAFKCPACHTVQSGFDLIAAGAGKDFDSIKKYLGFSCVGRFTHHKSPPKEKGTQEGCNWTLGGLFSINTCVVIDEDGKEHPHFEPATPEEAQAHREKNLHGTENR